MSHQNTFEENLTEAFTIISQNVAKTYISALYTYLQSSDKAANEISQSELLKAVNLPGNVRPGMANPSPGRVMNGTPASQRGKATAKAKAKAKAEMKNEERLHEDDGPPPIDSCGYVKQYGDTSGLYCLASASSEIYQLEEGPRRFCTRCSDGRKQVKEIITGTLNTLKSKKGRRGGGGRKQKNQDEVPPSTPGEFQSAIPGDTEDVQIKMIQLGDEGLHLVEGTEHIIWADPNGNGEFLAASYINGKILPPTESSKAWALEYSIEVVDLPDIFDEEKEQKVKSENENEKEQKVNPEPEESVVVKQEEDVEDEDKLDGKNEEPEYPSEEEDDQSQSPPKKMAPKRPATQSKVKTTVTTAAPRRRQPATNKPAVRNNTLMKIPGH